MNIGYLGPAGTFTEKATQKLIKEKKLEGYELIPFKDISYILYAVDEGKLDFGVVPAENSIEGSVNTTIDVLINEVNVQIEYEIILNITHNILGSNELKAIPKRVYSHPQALAQCRIFLKNNYPEIEKISTRSTGEAVQKVKENETENIAIASLEAAEINKLKVIEHNIGDYPGNQTKFYLVSKGKTFEQATEGKRRPRQKTSISFELKKDRPGGLFDILEIFKDKAINLTKIESRPAKDRLGNYIFILDCQADLNRPENAEVLELIGSRTSKLKVLGSFNVIS